MLALTVALMFQAPAPTIPPFALDLVPIPAAEAARELNVEGLRAHRKGAYAEAFPKFAAAVQANPRNVLARYNLACAAARLGDPETALTQLGILAAAPGCRWCRLKARGAAADGDFASLAEDPRFRALAQTEVAPEPSRSCGAPALAEPPVPVPAGVKAVDFTRVSPDGQWIALVGGYGTQVELPPIRMVEETDVWLMAFDGGALQKISTTRRGAGPAFAPDGKALVFVDGDDLWRIDVAGSGRRRLIRAAVPRGAPQSEYDYETYERPLISPDGRWVAVGKTSGAVLQLVVVPFAGGMPRPVGDVVDCYAWVEGALVVGDEDRFTDRWVPKSGKLAPLGDKLAPLGE